MPDHQPTHGKPYSRREFLHVAGVAGATLGAGAGLGGLLAACGEAETTTTTAGATTTTAGATTTTAGATTTTAGATTTSAAGAEVGREIKVGWIAPLTGGLASFGVPDRYCAERWAEYAGDGVVCGDGKKHPIKFLTTDSQSDSNRAAQVAGDLINNSKIDVMLVASTPDTVNPVADQCEALGTPCLSNDCPWQSYYFGRMGPNATPDQLAKGFKWTYHAFWGLEDMTNNFRSMWDSLTTNKVIGAMWPNDADGNAFRPAWTPFLKEAGYKLIDPGAYQNGTEDFTQQISAFKNAGVEVLTGVMIPPDFTNFWKQAIQQGWKPAAATVGKALLFPQSVWALGNIAYGLSSECWWHPTHPFKSSLTGETCAELAAAYEKKVGEQWTQPLLHYIVGEMAFDTLKRAKNLDDKESIMEAVRSMKVDTIGGPLDFSAPVAEGTNHPVPNVSKTPQAGGQWMKYPPYDIDIRVVGNASAPAAKVEFPFKPLAEFKS